MIDISKKLKPIIDKFILELEEVYKQAQGELKQAEIERLGAESDRRAIRVEQDKVDALNKAKNEDLKAEKAETLKERKSLEAEFTKQTILNSDLAGKVKKADDNLKETEELKKLATVELEKRKKINEDLQQKSNLLKDDFSKLDNERKVIVDRENKIALKEKSQLIKEEAQNSKEYELAERELKVSNDEKRIKGEWKRLNAAK